MRGALKTIAIGVAALAIWYGIMILIIVTKDGGQSPCQSDVTCAYSYPDDTELDYNQALNEPR
jgi:hypothetical protein